MMEYLYTLDLARDSNPYYASNHEMFTLLLQRVINNPQHYAPTKAINQPLRDWMNMVTSYLGIYKVNVQTFIILNGITCLPHCKQCGNTLSSENFKNIYYGFRDFCCGKCRAKWDTEHWTYEKHQTLSNALKCAYQSLPDDIKRNHRKKILDYFHNRTVEQKQHAIYAYKQTCANRTEEEKAKLSKRLSDAYHNMPEEKKILRNKHISTAIQNMDPEKKAHKNRLIGQKNHQNWMNKNETERESYRNARRIAAANRTQETIDKMVNACNKTKRKNRSFNTSKPEENAFQKLVMVFGIDDIARQYNCYLYPFNCDFYIKSLDLFIECNYFWQHGKHPFDPNDETDIKILEKWKNRSNSHKAYKRAIYVWTQLDVKKQQIAKDNKLNYQTFYSIKDFDAWIESFNELGEHNEKTI